MKRHLSVLLLSVSHIKKRHVWMGKLWSNPCPALYSTVPIWMKAFLALSVNFWGVISGFCSCSEREGSCVPNLILTTSLREEVSDIQDALIRLSPLWSILSIQEVCVLVLLTTGLTETKRILAVVSLLCLTCSLKSSFLLSILLSSLIIWPFDWIIFLVSSLFSNFTLQWGLYSRSGVYVQNISLVEVLMEPTVRDKIV